METTKGSSRWENERSIASSRRWNRAGTYRAQTIRYLPTFPPKTIAIIRIEGLSWSGYKPLSTPLPHKH